MENNSQRDSNNQRQVSVGLEKQLENYIDKFRHENRKTVEQETTIL